MSKQTVHRKYFGSRGRCAAVRSLALMLAAVSRVVLPREWPYAPVVDPFGQDRHAVRLDWGPTGAGACAADLNIVVDVLSFSTAVTVAVERGVQVLPCPWRDPRADEFARAHDAVLAVGRLEATRVEGPPMLSPAGLLRGLPVPRLVLPSPNGSTIAARLGALGAEVAIGCLRNAAAVSAVAARTLAEGRSIAIVAAGERWAIDDSLRPALEDHLGAGAIACNLRELGYARVMSPEATAAAELFAASRSRISELLQECVGGRELIDKGFADDVTVACEMDAATVVPVLRHGVFQPL